MSLHPSLRTKPSGLNQFRTVLTRGERINVLRERGDHKDGDSPLGLVKVAQRRMVAKKKKKAEKEEGEGTEAVASES
ncbi:MAG: small basic protein [Phycisphaerales bacterium]|nr:small basic protein [Phycisphaerales bacterium]